MSDQDTTEQDFEIKVTGRTEGALSENARAALTARRERLAADAKNRTTATELRGYAGSLRSQADEAEQTANEIDPTSAVTKTESTTIDPQTVTAAITFAAEIVAIVGFIVRNRRRQRYLHI
ncbi:MAG TPA: hypothetical protein VFT64_07110 [Rickettsiales bacterium]|nr:hypothetical protein [Rickettsiales bacterium]